jgi:hypothetical protein
MSSPNTNIDDIFEEFEKDYQEGSGSMAFAKASIEAKTQLEALITAAKIEELEKLPNHTSINLYVRERIKELEQQ